MIVQLGAYVLDIDIRKTRQFYQKADKITAGCGCSGCRNFEIAAEALPDEVKNFFNSLGVDLQKPAEAYVNTKNSDGSLLYGGFYHLSGRLLSGESAWEKISETAYRWNGDKAYQVLPGFAVSFQEKCSLVEEGFPEPVLQMDILANIPWVLEEANVYL